MRILYVTLLILGFTPGIFMETCPSEEDISPCTCQNDESGDIEVQCVGSIDLKILKEALSSLSGKRVEELHFSDLKLGKLASNFFKGIHIKRLEFVSCYLDSLTNDDQPGLLGLENYLEELEISKSFHRKGFDLKEVPINLNFGHLKKLKELELSDNYITEIGDDWFSNGPFSLEILSIKGGLVHKIGDNVFSQLSNLKELHLEGFKYGPITRSMLPSPADKLEILEMRLSHFAPIMPEDIFSKMPSLSKIILPFSDITTLDESTWSPIWQQLDELDLLGNDIRCDFRLNWIFRLKKIPRVVGYCNAPKKVKNLPLEDFFNSRRIFLNYLNVFDTKQIV